MGDGHIHVGRRRDARTGTAGENEESVGSSIIVSTRFSDAARTISEGMRKALEAAGSLSPAEADFLAAKTPTKRKSLRVPAARVRS